MGRAETDFSSMGRAETDFSRVEALLGCSRRRYRS